MSVLVLDDDDIVIYSTTSLDQLPYSLREVQDFGIKGQYRNLVLDRVVSTEGCLKPRWNGYEIVETFKHPPSEPPKLSMDPSTDGTATLMKENENLKQRIIEQERQLNLIRSHLGL